ncbi:Attractin [Geodia barretti]|uniref:Attractin n=1 Tax=Geodia barretti TaxID=519541 RepID=A0AA35T6K1_GEOBA|nr:Attractin [Geodia barretti]
MHVFGGVLIPEERITNEHWVLHLPTLTWSPLTLSPDPNDDVIDNSTSYNLTGVDDDNSVVVTTANHNTVKLPLRVRSHTAHMVSTVMIVLFGMSDLQHKFFSFVQEYDLESGEWSVPVQNGMKPGGRMGHSSVYDEDSGLVYVYGGQIGDRAVDDLLVYDPVTRYWSKRESGPSASYLHTANLLWGQLMLVFGGSCFSSNLMIYNIGCDEWYETDYLGLPGDAGRLGHVAFVDPSTSSLTVFGGFLGLPLADMFLFNTGDCSAHAGEEECAANGTVFCGWSQATNSSVPLADNPTNLHCSVDECLKLSSCDECLTGTNCTWTSDDSTCRTGSPDLNATCPSPSLDSTVEEAERCGRFSSGSCWGCMASGCQWTIGGECVDSSLNVTTTECSVPCPKTNCSSCAGTDRCLWCPSLNSCFPSSHTQSYAVTFPFGQCLGYSSSCPVPCDNHVTCTDCHGDPECGWCRDPADTGLGTCSPGGFLSPLSFSSNSCPDKHWFFEQCPACQCNGHSTCVNESVCEECQNNTQGANCDECSDGYFGNAKGGGVCTECFCNDYPASCDKTTGECMCHDVGVTGPSCSVCASNNSYIGDPDNFCYYEMSVGFVYTFEVSDPRERESFYLTVPPDDVTLSFKFKLRSNPDDRDVVVELFLGKVSEGLWVLANISGPITVSGTGEFSRELDDRPGSRNSTFPPLFSFAHPRFRNFSNFTDLFAGRRERDYTRKMWDGNVALVIRVSNLTNPITFRITLDQTNLWFLLYFFATFIICFTGLLTAFMIGWYLKRKIELRRYMRVSVHH